MQHWAGRQAKRDQKVLKAKLGDDPEPLSAEPVPGIVGQLDKSELRRRATQLRAANGHHLPGVQP
jgi:hypothetical protein